MKDSKAYFQEKFIKPIAEHQKQELYKTIEEKTKKLESLMQFEKLLAFDTENQLPN